ncbi:hypothetical protein N7499_005438 [Penicillium canescens]|nr:hypothetical protein N7499_005438 [Penicillium canescens]KAJ6177646.1 hypothetical protein N7485_004560 [Penicillium canescens]
MAFTPMVADGLMFYEMDSLDLKGTSPWKRTVESSYVDTFEGTVNQFAEIAYGLDSGVKLSAASFVSDTSPAATTSLMAVSKVNLMSTSENTKRTVSKWLPDGYGRVFHPQILLHEIISALVVYNMVDKNEQDHGLPAIPETISFDSCPYYPSSGSNSSDDSDDSNASSSQQIAVASYINPLGDPSAWEHLIDDYPSDKMPILIANVVNGPDSTVNDDWTNVIKRASASGKTVLGYVRTGYLGVSDQKFLTRLGSGDLADWTAQIEQDIDMWYTLYGSDIGGIFFDEGWPECGDNDKYVDLYKYINDYTKRTHPGAYTILNPGSPMASCFEDSMDTLLTFELSYDAYVNSYTPNDWIPKDPRKLWHIIYNVPDSAIDEVITLSKKRGAGFIQLTDDLLPNPYDNLPADSYIKKILDAVDGGSLLNEDASSWQSGNAAGTVSGLTVVTSEYTSAQLSWYPASGALGYHVYSGNTVVASVPNTMTQITLGGLTPGASHDFHVSAVGGGGDLGSSSNTVTVVTDSLPNGKTVTNWHSTPQEGSTIIKADILVPYAFVRLYLWDSVGCDFDTDPGWSVNFKVDKYVCTHYMAWTSMSTITLDITDYTYTWTLPLGTLTTDTSKFVIQTQGYNVQGNFVEPDASDYDCEGSTMCSTPDMLKWCDHAVNYLHRDDDPFYNTNGAASQTGNCWGDQTRGCGAFVQGTNCSISGNDMWNDYQNIRKIGGCGKCGTYHRGNGCLVTIDYVYQCNNHD